jgi:hypothetical protein
MDDALRMDVIVLHQLDHERGVRTIERYLGHDVCHSSPAMGRA